MRIRRLLSFLIVVDLALFALQLMQGRLVAAQDGAPAKPQMTLPVPPPPTKAAVGQWDADLVQRAASMLASPAQWNHADAGKCPAGATLSINCALQKALEESAGVWRDKAGSRTNQAPARSD